MSRWDERGDRYAESAYQRPVRTAAGTGCIFGLVVIVLVVVGVGVSWAAGWLNGAAETTGFQNAKGQTTAVIDDEQGMIAAAGNVCDAKSEKSSADDPVLVGGGAAFEYRAQYRRLEADYNRRMVNVYEARLVIKLPTGGSALPRVAPTLIERLQEVC